MVEIDITKISPDVLALNPELGRVARTVPASKYHNARAEVKGMRFQSGREASGVASLILLEDQKKIFSLRLQVRFPLHAGLIYTVDAVYLDEKLKVHVIDFKGFSTKEYRLKKKLFFEKYNQKIEEVR